METNINNFNLKKVNEIALELINTKYFLIADKINKKQLNREFFELFSKEVWLENSYTNYINFLQYYFLEYGKSENT